VPWNRWGLEPTSSSPPAIEKGKHFNLLLLPSLAQKNTDMGKKSKQAGSTGSEGLTYMERRALGHGTRSERLGKDSLSNFYDCRLTLAPAVDPVVTPSGFLFSREAILKNLLEQKKAGRRALEEWEAAKEKRAAGLAEAQRRAAEAEARAFERAVNSGGASSSVVAAGANTNNDNNSNLIVGSSTIAANRERGLTVRAAWGTSAGAVAASEASVKNAEELRLARLAAEKPDTSSRCPASGGKLRLKDLIPIRFYRLGDRDEGDGGGEGDEKEGEETEAARAKRRASDAAAALSAAGGNGYAFDPVTRDPLTNATAVVVLLPSGCAMSETSYKTCVKPDGTWKGKKITGVIRLQGGGTGFAAHDGKAAEAASHFALGAGSGRADVRGQLAAGGSRFGLKFAN
jgi:nitric oxide synthase-interacting protein